MNLINVFGSTKTMFASDTEAASKSTSVDLHQLLLNIAQWGEVSMFRLKGGWFCKLEMHVELLGTSIDVRSEFGHKDPSSAVLQCQERAIALRKTQGLK